MNAAAGHLANVLIKILGLSVCVYAVPMCVLGTVIWLGNMSMGKDTAYMGILSSAASSAVQAIVGIVIIAKSRKLAEFWFKNEDE